MQVPEEDLPFLGHLTQVVETAVALYGSVETQVIMQNDGPPHVMVARSFIEQGEEGKEALVNVVRAFTIINRITQVGLISEAYAVNVPVADPRFEEIMAAANEHVNSGRPLVEFEHTTEIVAVSVESFHGTSMRQLPLKRATNGQAYLLPELDEPRFVPRGALSPDTSRLSGMLMPHEAWDHPLAVMAAKRFIEHMGMQETFVPKEELDANMAEIMANVRVS